MTVDIVRQLERGGAALDRVVAVTARGVLWRRADYAPFPDRPYVVHEIVGGRIGNGSFDLTEAEGLDLL